MHHDGAGTDPRGSLPAEAGAGAGAEGWADRRGAARMGIRADGRSMRIVV